MKDSRYYRCDFCYKEFEPKRRRVQKFCSNTCRSKAWQEKQQQNNKPIVIENKPLDRVVASNQDKITLPGITNAAIGTATVDAIKYAFTPEDKKAATRGDLKVLLQTLEGRYHPINNLHKDEFNRKPYYDIIDKVLVYF